MFNDILVQAHLNRQLYDGSNGLVVCHFGPDSAPSLAAVSQTQDKVLIFGILSNSTAKSAGRVDEATYILVQDVIYSLTSCRSDDVGKLYDILIMGCANSLIFYDTKAETNLFRVGTTTKINTFSLKSNGRDIDCSNQSVRMVLCGGAQKICAIKASIGVQAGLQYGEVASEKSTNEIINCMTQGLFHGVCLILTGSFERKIRAYQIDLFDFNIRACRLTIEEAAQIICLCGIETVAKSDDTKSTPVSVSLDLTPSILPTIDQTNRPETTLNDSISSNMSHFAFALDNGSIGVYSLFENASSAQDAHGQSLGAERLWRHRSKHKPIRMIMFDVDDDGYDELVIAYRNGRLEARSPLSGQLLAQKQCFKADRLVGLQLLPEFTQSSSVKDSKIFPSFDLAPDQQKNMKPESNQLSALVVSSTNSHLVVIKLQNTCEHRLLNCFEGMSKFGYESHRPEKDSFHEAVESDFQPRSLKFSVGQIEPHLGDKIDFEFDESNDPTQPIKPIDCETKQSVDLLQKLSRLQNELNELEKRACNVYHDAVQQVAAATASTDHWTANHDICVAYRWDLDQSSAKLKLSIMISCSSLLVDFLEMIDSNEDLIEGGRLIVSLDQVAADAVSRCYMCFVDLEHRTRQSVKLILRIYCCYATTRNKSKLIDQRTVAFTHESFIDLPRFSSLILDKENMTESDESHRDTIKINLKLDEHMFDKDEDKSREHKTEVLDWFGKNFLFLRIHQWITEDDNDSSLWTNRRHPIKPSEAMPIPLYRMTNIEALYKLIQKLTLNEQNDELDTHKSMNTHDIDELRIKLKECAVSGAKDLSILIISYGQGVLRVEGNNHELLIEIVQCLVEQLNLEIKPDSVQQSHGGVEPILRDLEKLSQDSSHLEESERRVQTELYEASDLIQGLIQQICIAQQIHEFTIAKELLGEISMILDGARNSAKAYHLNNRERLRLTLHVRRLRENITFLLGQ